MRQVWDTTKEQRCWVHKMANILDKMPKGAQPKAKAALREIYGAETKAEAEEAFDLFVKTYRAKYPNATECLEFDAAVKWQSKAIELLSDAKQKEAYGTPLKLYQNKKPNHVPGQ
jgi:transposase-like protein